jgi:uncharacterized protein YbjT (DUF2867 family)
MKIAVAGATGRVGRHVVDVVKERGHEAVAIARSAGVDVVSGQGLAAALVGVTAVVDATSNPTPDEAEATAFFTAAARNLPASAAPAGVRRIVPVSIIGIERFSGGYLAAKVAHERALRKGPVPVRILRAAQFHEFVGQLVDWGRQGDVAYVMRMKTQLVAARSVAEVLVDLALDDRPGAFPTREIAGPRPEDLVDAARRLVARRGETVRIEGVTNPADPDAHLYESGAALPGPGALLAGPTFDAWLATL